MASTRTQLPQVLSVPKFADWAKISRRTVWRHLRTKRLQCVLIGARKYVVVPEVDGVGKA
jgi:hypothetical protein